MRSSHKEITLDEWKDSVSKSSHKREHEVVTFSDDGTLVRASINLSEARSIFLGAYCLKTIDGFKENTGWYHP
jgi:hypothetical protein